MLSWFFISCSEPLVFQFTKTFDLFGFPIIWFSWSWLHGSWIYNYMSNEWLSPLKLWVESVSWRGVLDTALCDQVFQWLATGRWYSLGTIIPSANKTDSQDKNRNIVESGVKHHNPNPVILPIYFYLPCCNQMYLPLPFFR